MGFSVIWSILVWGLAFWGLKIQDISWSWQLDWALGLYLLGPAIIRILSPRPKTRRRQR